MPHSSARLTIHGRRLLVERVRAGRPVAHVADEMGISRTTAHKWVRRWRAEGDGGLYDRSSRPLMTPHRTSVDIESHICKLRRERKLGPARIGPILDMPASTVHRVLTRHQLNRLSWINRPTGQVIRRYERERPGELVHVDIKKLGKSPTAADIGSCPASRPPASAGHNRRAQERQSRDRLQLRPHSRRRSLPARLQRGPVGRAQGDCGLLLGASERLLLAARHHRRACPHRQRFLLPIPAVCPDSQRRQHHP